MAVFRVEKNKGYTVMSNHHLRNKELSLKAKGLLSQMLSLPEDWDYTLAGLSLINRESIDAIRTAVWELEKAGYITRRQGRDEKGKMTAIEYTIYEQPQPPALDCPVLENPTADKPILENPTPDNPTSENPTQLNKEIQKTNLPKKEKLNTDISSTHSIPFHSLNPSPLEDAAQPPERKRKEATDAYSVYEEIIKDNIEYDYLIQDRYLDRDRIEEILALILETVCTKRRTIRIAGDDHPAELVKAKFMKLNSEHIRFVLDCMQENTTKIYQIKGGDETRDLRFEPYDRLTATGHRVDAKNYTLVYSAELTPGTSLEDIYTRFNIDHPKDFKGHSLSVSDVVVLHQNGQDTAHYVDSFGYKEVPEFFKEQENALIPADLETGETIKTPRGTFYVTAMSREQMEAAGYGLHHQSDDGKYLIMGNGTRAFAVPVQPENYLKAAEQTTEQNYNMIDGQINNTPTTAELEAKVKAGETISLVDLAEAVKADKERGKAAKTEKKPSIRAQLRADKEKTAQKKAAKSKNHELEV